MSENLATLHDDLQDLLGQTIAGRYRVGALIASRKGALPAWTVAEAMALERKC